MGEGCALSMDSNGRQGKGSVHAGRCRGSGETSFCRVLAVTGATCISSFNPHNDPGGGAGNDPPSGFISLHIRRLLYLMGV